MNTRLKNKNESNLPNGTPDYNEPWSIQKGHLSTSLFDGEGVYFADIHELVCEDSSVAWAKAERIVACVNTCSKMADPAAEIAAMREAINEARDLLLSLEHEGNEKGTRCISCGSHCSEPHKESCNMLSALAKLQPFITP